ncbi:MAG TPA: cyclic 2,3-diphosphoglycerate synthase [Actinomycetota bacterium]|nr:cyclic 2,3-diphosphoglycerate synthase [Actinomycetota bacterium]
MTRRVLIMGAAGRDFHNFNVFYRDNPDRDVVAFTATQIPFIDERKYPAELAGPRYPDGIQIHDEDQLADLIRDLHVDEVVFAYSDVSHEYVMHRASTAMAAGPSWILLGPNDTMLDATVPVVAVCAVRTGSGKSQTTRKVIEVLKAHGKTAVVVRHPMPYGDLVAQRVQRFETFDDLTKHHVTLEEREEYEPHLHNHTVVYAGVDYGAILEQAQQEADVVVWDGGNNDYPFYRPTVHMTVVDPLRAGHELTYHPGELNLRLADVCVINKIDSATEDQLEAVERSIATVNPSAVVIKARSPVTVEDPAIIPGKRVLVIEDGPTLTHGEMRYGAGVVAARQHGAASIVDPREHAVGSMRDIYAKYEIGPVLPAMGYSAEQLAEFEHMINATDCDAVLIATPIDLRALVHIEKPATRVRYDLEEAAGSPTVADALAPVLA